MWVPCLALPLGRECGTAPCSLVTEPTEQCLTGAQTFHTDTDPCRFLLSQQGDADVALVNQFLQFLRLYVVPLSGIFIASPVQG
jgi:hypothetical protein